MSGFWAMAVEAGEEARLVLAAGKARGAASRAYYAMFDAARAALEQVDPDLLQAKTHRTIISRFGKEIVTARGLDPELGRFINSTEDSRIAADYDQGAFDIGEARNSIERMEKFLMAVADFLGEPRP